MRGARTLGRMTTLRGRSLVRSRQVSSGLVGSACAGGYMGLIWLGINTRQGNPDPVPADLPATCLS